ncbi:MAG: 50S ribosomal protein L32 [Phycisphaerae bacterium]|nr:50S ribosomal protein L32 [Phycisphaerae bacterium]
MPVPAFRTSPGRKRRRRSHDAISKTRTVMCPNCGTPRRPHAACSDCGYVRPGLQIKHSISSEE